MGTLVRTLYGDTIAADLHAAYTALAAVYLEHRGIGGHALLPTDPVDLDRLVLATEERIDLREARKRCKHIDADSERPVEVFNNLVVADISGIAVTPRETG